VTDDLEAAWDSVPAAPTVASIDPVEQLCRTFRGAIAANPALWRSVDLEAATSLLTEMAQKRPSSTSIIALEPVVQRLVTSHAPRNPLAESLLAFQKEARELGFQTALPRVVAELGTEKQQALLRGYYARLARGGEGADARQKALAGTLIVFSLPPRTEALAKVLGACVVLGGLWLVLDPGGRPPGPKRLSIVAPDDALPCERLEAHGLVLRCTLAPATLRDFSVDEERARRQQTRAFARTQGLQDLLVLDHSGTPLSPR
jgi:hypothetical protein